MGCELLTTVFTSFGIGFWPDSLRMIDILQDHSRLLLNEFSRKLIVLLVQMRIACNIVHIRKAKKKVKNQTLSRLRNRGKLLDWDPSFDCPNIKVALGGMSN